MKDIKINLGSDIFTCSSYYENENDNGVEVKKGRKLIGRISNLKLPTENTFVCINEFNKNIENFLDINYY